MRGTRREFLETIVVAAGTLCLAPVASATSWPGAEPFDIFPQGVASGDPKPTSIILWTRTQLPVEHVDSLPPFPVRVQLAHTPRFAEQDLVVDASVDALSRNGRCVRVKITGLSPRQTYFYRFLAFDGLARSRVGRTRTAPAPHAATPVRFAYANCQDFVGRWFNSYLPLLTREYNDLDFLVHLGDFIYETTGDPRYAHPTSQRSVHFDDAAGAIRLGEADAPYLAARTLSNYRQLHRHYRSDRILQRVLARFPLVAIWDDHEFSDDSWRTTSTYFEGRKPESDPERLRNAERAWLEYMPIDDAPDEPRLAEIIDTAPDRLYPNVRIWRGLRFGRTVNLTLTDYRSFRSDHLIPEDGFPAEIIATEDHLRTVFAQFGYDFTATASGLQPYVAWTSIPPQSRLALQAALSREYAQAGYVGDAAAKASAVLTGNLAVPFLNRRLAAMGLAILAMDGLPLGLSYEVLGKVELFSTFGSRYAVNQKWFDLLAVLRTAAAQVAYGEQQTAFLRESLEAAAHHGWNIVANSTSNTSMILDLAQQFEDQPEFKTLPQELQTILTLFRASPLGARLKLNVDKWDGFPLRREQLLRFYRRLGNVVLIAGDIHASWVTDHSNADGPLVEFTGPAISSSSLGEFILRAIAAGVDSLGLPASVPDTLARLFPDLVTALHAFVFDRAAESPFFDVQQEVIFADVVRNGVVVCEANGETFTTTYWLLPTDDVAVSYYSDQASLLAKFERRQFRVSKSDGLQAI
ncbi:MAG: alkaline phosphatase D family protein [Rhodospirillales bacterium]|nr:alkaline phosphatase D family protein [Rhodospirillales bacterium]